MDSKLFLLFSLLPALSLAAIGDIYVGCGDTKQCYGYFSNSCVDTASCDMIVSWRQLDSETMEFEVQASAAGLGFDDPLTWVAVGFSRDNDMGQDTAVITSGSFGGGSPLTRLYWNENKSVGTVEVGDNSGVGDAEFEQGEEAGLDYIYARFTRSVSLTYLAPKGDPPTPTEETNDLRAEQFWLLAAVGPIDPDTMQPTRHRYASSSVDPFQFAV